MYYFIFLIKVTVIFNVLLILTRLLGKKQMSQLTYFNYVTGITIGSVSANMMNHSNKQLLDDFIGLILWCILTYLMGHIGLKSGGFRKIVDDQPTIVIKKGRIMKEALKRVRLNMDDLMMMLREEGVFSITVVEYAIFEPNGKLSVMKKPENEEVTKADMKLPIPSFGHIQAELIVDGRIIYHNLKEFNLDKVWLVSQLKLQNICDEKNILYAELQEDGSLYVQKY